MRPPDATLLARAGMAGQSLIGLKVNKYKDLESFFARDTNFRRIKKQLYPRAGRDAPYERRDDLGERRRVEMTGFCLGVGVVQPGRVLRRRYLQLAPTEREVLWTVILGPRQDRLDDDVRGVFLLVVGIDLEPVDRRQLRSIVDHLDRLLCCELGRGVRRQLDFAILRAGSGAGDQNPPEDRSISFEFFYVFPTHRSRWLEEELVSDLDLPVSTFGRPVKRFLPRIRAQNGQIRRVISGLGSYS